MEVESEEWNDNREAARAEDAADEEIKKAAIPLKERSPWENGVDPTEHGQAYHSRVTLRGRGRAGASGAMESWRILGHGEDRMSMLGEFRAFLLKHGVLGLAVAVVIGGAVSKLVTAVVADLIMPIVGALTPSGDWRAAVLRVGNMKFAVGDFGGSFLDFLIISIVVFLIVKRFMKEEPPKEEPAKS
jgi:large conductance mechanosensitive channel